MCRSIKVLRRPPEPATVEEIRAAALQYIRKVSGTRNPPAVFAKGYESAVDEVAAATERLLALMAAPKPPRERKNARQQP